MNELFEVGISLSPKLAWLKQHGLETEHFPGVSVGDECPETGDTLFPWVCRTAKGGSGNYSYSSPLWYSREIGAGATEEEAICDFCQNSGIPHYSVDSPASPRGTQGAPDSSLPERG